MLPMIETVDVREKIQNQTRIQANRCQSDNEWIKEDFLSIIFTALSI